MVDDNTNFDFANFPLWCGGLRIQSHGTRLPAQLAYHWGSIECEDPDFIAARNAVLTFANKFHRAEECGILMPITVRSAINHKTEG